MVPLLSSDRNPLRLEAGLGRVEVTVATSPNSEPRLPRTTLGTFAAIETVAMLIVIAIDVSPTTP